MPLPQVKIGGLSVSKLIIGGNPFSGFSHQSADLDVRMRHYFTTAHIKETLNQAHAAGIDAHISRADHHVMRYLMEHWDEGGRMKWIAQTCPELGLVERGIHNALASKASAAFIHGGSVDNFLATGKFQEVFSAIEMARAAKLPIGVAGHLPGVFQWAEANIDVDFYMCSYYNPIPRVAGPEHVHGFNERFDDEDRQAMVATIAGLSKPVIHYKVLAAGRNDPRQALAFVADHLRPQDAVCIGIYPQDHPNMIAQNVEILMANLQRTAKV